MFINRLKGNLSDKGLNYACLEVAGIEWKLLISQETLAQLPQVGQQCSLYAHLRISENHNALYGFYTEEERRLFDALILVPGLGPKIAQGLLSQARCDDILHYIQNKDDKALSKLPGIGLKTAQKIIVQLADQLAKLELRPSDSPAAKLSTKTKITQEQEDLIISLIAMGYDARQARSAVEELYEQWQTESILPAEAEQLRQAIVKLGT